MDFFEKHEISRPSRPYTERDFNSRIPRYNDDSDYTTNAPSYYDDLARKNQLLKTLSYRIWEYQEVINKQFNEWDEEIKKRFLEWDKNLEEFDEEVMKLLRQWINDGTFADIINEEIFSWKADKEYVDAEFERIDKELDEKANKNQLEYSVKDFGAKGDGVTDDTDAFKTAGLLGQAINVPEGIYIVNDTVQMVSGSQFIGMGNNSIIKGRQGGILFKADGSYSDKTALVQNSEIGDHFVTVSNTSPFNIGDDIRIMSQRIATNRDDTGEDYWLGVSTGSNHRVHFGEIKTLSQKNASQLFFRGGLIFPDYLTHDNNETDERAGRNSTVQKINFVENIKISNMRIEGNYSNVARLSICKNSVVENLTWENVENSTFVMFVESYQCEGRYLKLKYNAGVPSAGVYSRNGLRTVSTVNCGFKYCTVEHGTQCIDFTYNTNGATIPNINSYVEGCTVIGAVNNSMTSHGGSYRARIVDNTMINCHTDGIMSRTREALIQGNTVTGSGNVESGGVKYGITLYQGASVNCIVTDNMVSGFSTGIATRSGADTTFRYVGAIISNNSISGCTTGFAFRHGDRPHNARAEIVISNNSVSNFVGEYGKFLNIYQYIRGLKIINNIFVGNDSVNGGIFTRGNSFDFDIIGNTFRGVSRVLWFEDVTDQSVLGRAPYYITYDNNYTFGQLNTDNMGNIVFSRNYHYGNLYPYKTEHGLLGYSDYRFKGIYTVEAPNSLSDRKYKTSIENETLGLDFLKHLNPVTYQFKNDSENKKRHGLIAQELEEVFDKLDIKSPGIIEKNNDEYGLRYEELISILIKSVQELNDKIKGE